MKQNVNVLKNTMRKQKKNLNTLPSPTVIKNSLTYNKYFKQFKILLAFTATNKLSTFFKIQK